MGFLPGRNCVGSCVVNQEEHYIENQEIQVPFPALPTINIVTLGNIITLSKILFIFFFYFLFFKFYFIFKLNITVLDLPNIKMNPPQVYMCSPS